MFKRRIKTIGLMTLLCFTTNVVASKWMCGKDLTRNGDVDSPGELASCFVDGKSTLCPIEAVQCDAVKGRYQCPLGDDIACVNKNGTPMCSPNSCVDIEAQKPDEEDSNAGDMLIDDGKRDGEGNCIDKMYIFSGRFTECKPKGMTTAYKNCCEDKGVVFLDSTGSLASITRAGSAIKSMYGVAKAAYAAYQAELAASGSAEAATAAAQGAAEKEMLAAFDPTSLAIAIAIYLIVDYLEKACEQQDMETAMLNGSGYCVPVGDYCKKKISGIGCVQKANTFCCFNSKLARIIHQQGRKQLNTFNGFGSEKSPDCRGFTPDEFQSLDFSKIDLSEYEDDLRHRAQKEINDDIRGKVDDFINKTH